MSTIHLAAQRSYTTQEPVWFSYRLPPFKRLFCATLLWMVGILALFTAGVYAHLYWNLRHPLPETVKVSLEKPETQLSDMHYVYISKPFPQPEPKPAPLPKQTDMPPLQEMPIPSDNADWQQAPDGDTGRDSSRDTLPGTRSHNEDSASPASNDASLKELLLQAIKDQQKDYSQGKEPAPPVDETVQAAQEAGKKPAERQETKRPLFTP